MSIFLYFETTLSNFCKLDECATTFLVSQFLSYVYVLRFMYICETNQKHRKQANHSEKIVLNSSEMNRKKIALFERQRVCDFRFTSDEFINFCRQMSGLRVFVFPLSMYNLNVRRNLISPHQKRGALAPLIICS